MLNGTLENESATAINSSCSYFIYPIENSTSLREVTKDGWLIK